MGEPEPEPEDDLYELPAWSLSRDSDEWIQIANPLPERVDREWALAGATGKGVRVCLLDSGVEDGHPLVGPVTRAVAITSARTRSRSRRRISKATSAGTGRRAPASSMRSRRRRRSTRCACSEPGSPARGGR